MRSSVPRRCRKGLSAIFRWHRARRSARTAVTGDTTASPFFADAPDTPFAFRKRALHAGAGIGLHQHHHDEICYVLSGSGRYILDGVVHDVTAGDALLTRTGSTHAIHQTGDQDLMILIVYPSKR